MFRKTQNEQLELFKDISLHLSDAAAKRLEAPSAWNTVFYNQRYSSLQRSRWQNHRNFLGILSIMGKLKYVKFRQTFEWGK